MSSVTGQMVLVMQYIQSPSAAEMEGLAHKTIIGFIMKVYGSRLLKKRKYHCRSDYIILLGIQWNLHNTDTLQTLSKCPYYRGVLSIIW